jgi:hypothetical protein
MARLAICHQRFEGESCRTATLEDIVGFCPVLQLEAATLVPRAGRMAGMIVRAEHRLARGQPKTTTCLPGAVPASRAACASRTSSRPR